MWRYLIGRHIRYGVSFLYIIKRQKSGNVHETKKIFSNWELLKEKIMVIVVGNGHGDTSSTLDEADCISHSTNTIGKGMNPIILPPAMDK